MKKEQINSPLTEPLRRAIVDSGLPLYRLANETGVARASLIRFVRGESSIRLDIADRLAVYFGFEFVAGDHSTRKEKGDSIMRTQPELVILPNHAGYEGDAYARFEDFLHNCRVGEVGSWSCKKSAQWRDVYLFYFGEPVYELAGLGVCDSEIVEGENNGFDWTKAPVAWFCEYRPLIAFPSPLTREDIRTDGLLSDWWSGRPFQGGPKTIKYPGAADRLVEMILQRNPSNPEIASVLAKFRSIILPRQMPKKRQET